MKVVFKKNGFSVVEVLVAFVILTVVITAATLTQISNSTATMRSKEKTFAYQKAVQMLDELRALVEGGTEEEFRNLDSKADTDDINYILTTVDLPLPSGEDLRPLDPLSGNYRYKNGWRFGRRVEINRKANDINSRDVRISVFWVKEDGTPVLPPLSEIYSVLRTAANSDVPTQVIDNYVLTMGNAAAWWSELEHLKPAFENTVSDLKSRNLGLNFKSHYITTLSYGRDPYYAPYSSLTNTTATDPNLKYAYYYPGKISNTVTGTDGYYFLIDDMRREGARLNLDGTVENNWVDSSGEIRDDVYSVADQFNHSVRYPEERAIYQRLKKRRNDYNDTLDLQTLNSLNGNQLEPTYRLLLEEMNSTDKQRNSLFVNLHGELVTYPPLRNYSDAAVDAKNSPNVRVVTHPERLKYNNSEYDSSSEPVILNVYTYLRDPSSTPDNVNEITLFIPTDNKTGANSTDTGNSDSTLNSDIGLPSSFELDLGDISSSKIKIRHMKGKAGTASTGLPYSWIDNTGATPALPLATTRPTDGSAAYNITLNPFYDFNGDGTKEKRPGILITLYNSPTKHGLYTGSGTGQNTGLPSTRMLYGMQYVPAYIGTTSPDYQDLTNNSNTKVKNTARWKIQLDMSGTCDMSSPSLACFRGSVMSVETRIGGNLNTGLRIDGSVNEYDGSVSTSAVSSSEDSEFTDKLRNLSRTYVWLMNSSGTAPLLPFTERYQYQGDPRHNPYLDVRDDHGYNWFFGALSTSSSPTYASDISTHSDWFPQLTKVNDGRLFGHHSDSAGVECDAPRLNWLLREGILHSNSIFTSITGWSFYYFGLGGEIGSKGTKVNFNVKGDPYDSTSASDIDEDPWANGSPFNEILSNGTRIIANRDESWLSLPWLGELSTDRSFYNSGTYGPWKTKGNLKTDGSNDVDRFYRAKHNGSYKSIDYDSTTNTIQFGQYTRSKRIADSATPSFFNGGAASTNYHDKRVNHQGSPMTTNVTNLGKEVAKALNIPLPETITADRPFNIDLASGSGGDAIPDKWTESFYATTYGTQTSYLPLSSGSPNATIGDTTVFYKNSSGTIRAGSAAVMIRRPNETTNRNTGYVVLNGLAPQGTEGTQFMAKFSMSTLVHTFFRTGNFANSSDTSVLRNRTVQIPRIEITDPKSDPGTGLSPREGSEVTDPNVTLTWKIDWLKWDKQKYSSSYPDNWTESEITVKYNVMYSKNRGKTWKYISDGSNATSGTFNPDYAISDTSATWDTSSLSQGSTLFRIEAYRFDETENKVINLHYAYHQREFFLKK